MAKTRVVNRHAEAYDVYIGRGTIWGNPYRVGVDGTRTECIEKYGKLLEQALKHEDMVEELLKLQGKKLGCSCKPRPCHGDHIIKELEQRTSPLLGFTND